MSTPIEHQPWVGKEYSDGLDGQRIAIIGFSHHRAEDESDTTSFTFDVMQEVIDRDPYAFFRQVRQYFDAKAVETFWNRVLFFNFLPDCVGSDNQRYGDGTPEQLQRGKQRVLKLFAEHRPHKAFIFSKKAWENFPPAREEANGGNCPKLGPEFGGFSLGTYDTGGFVVTAFGLRHPERAPYESIHKAVQHILKL